MQTQDIMEIHIAGETYLVQRKGMKGQDKDSSQKVEIAIRDHII